jgi:hypothetical protein
MLENAVLIEEFIKSLIKELISVRKQAGQTKRPPSID